MIGGAMLTYPLLFKSAGLLTSTLVTLISGFISYRTCRINVIHSSPQDNDIEDTLCRHLGDKWKQFYMALSGYYFVVLNIIYIQLIVDQAYGMLYFGLVSTGHEKIIADKSVPALVFDRFSLQYLSLVLFFPLTALVFVKDLRTIMKLGEFGIGSVFIYLAFLAYMLLSKLTSLDYSLIKWWSFDIGSLAGTCALSFTIHTGVNAMIRLHRSPEKNEKVLLVSYACGALFYLFIGVVGSLIILDKGEKCKITLVNCFLDSWEVLLV